MIGDRWQSESLWGLQGDLGDAGRFADVDFSPSRSRPWIVRSVVADID